MEWAFELEQAIEKYGVSEHVAELQAVGATLVPMEKAGLGNEAVQRARHALLAHARSMTGAEWDIDKGPLDTLDEPGTPGYFFMSRMLEVDRVFLEFQCNPVLNTLHRAILGDEFRLCTSNGFLKWAHPKGSWGPNHGMHTDSPLVRPSGFGYGANCNWLLTDYTIDDGPICFIPGSHKRESRPGELSAADLASVKGVEGPAGSLFVFHASLWHGSLPRKTEGLRLSTHSQRRIRAVTPLWNFKDVNDALIESGPDPRLLRMLCWKVDSIFLMNGDEQPRIPRKTAPQAELTS